MNLQQFVNLHPKIIQYDRAGVDGIDLQALHEEIEKSRYLKSRQSFIFFVKNYSRILNGEYRDFKLDVVQEPEDPIITKQKELIKERIKELEALNVSDYDKAFICDVVDCICLLKKAVEMPFYMAEAFMKYKEVKEGMVDYGK